MTRYTVTLEVEINAITEALAKQRVEKALICIENSLRYAEPEIAITEVELV